MLLQLDVQFDPQRDVVPWLSEQTAPGDSDIGEGDFPGNCLHSLHTVNVERNGNIVYTWKGNHGHTYFGLYNFNSKKNQHLYTFEKDLDVISCSINAEKTLLAVSFLQSTKVRVNQLFQPASKCLTLLIEIHPVNNVKVLKAVDSCIRVQFLYPVAETNAFSESCLLLLSEDKYIEKFDIRVIREGHKVMIENSSQLSRERIVDDLIWAQWDMLEQRLFYIVPKESRDTLYCIQFYPDKKFKLILEAPLDTCLDDVDQKPVNLDYSYQHQEMIPKPLNIQVFTNETGCLCICYNMVPDSAAEVTYSVSFLHKGYSKTYTVALEKIDSLEEKDLAFLNLDYYVAVYLPGHFLHLLSTRHPELICHNLFLKGEDAKIHRLHTSSVLSPHKSVVLDHSTGRMFTVVIDKQALLRFLWNSKLDSDRLAVLHCLLLHVRSTDELQTQIIHWISEKTSVCFTFDPIQEFIMASLYSRMCLETAELDKLLPYTPLVYWNENLPGITCRTHIILLPVLKVQNCKGFWEKLSLSLDCVNAESHLHFNSKLLRKEWDELLSDERTEQKPTAYTKVILENAKRVLSSLTTRNTTQERIVPLFQEEDCRQQLLIGLMVAQLKDHLARYPQYIDKKKIDQVAVDYVSELLDLVCRLLEDVWKKHSLDSSAFALRQQRPSDEIVVFYLMCQILKATNELCVPLPPGFHTLHLSLGVQCLPLHTLLHYIDQGVLHLTETCAMKLLKGLEDNEQNEKLKLSILMRLPEAIGCKIFQLWTPPIRSSMLARNYVKLLLERQGSKQHSILEEDRFSARIQFLPLNSLVNMLKEMECQEWMASLEQVKMNARSIEELALKHTTVILGL